MHSGKDNPFFLFFSMTSPHEPVSPSDYFQVKSGMAPIADFVMETDWSVGEILQAVEEAGISENTLILFTADNGHSNYTGWEKLVNAGHAPSGPFRGHKGAFYTQKVEQLTKELRLIVERGTSREGEKQNNDVKIIFDTIQKVRWSDTFL